MSIPYNEREKAIRRLFEYEEEYDIPDSERLTFDQNAAIPSISEVSAQKKAYVDIRNVIARVNNLKK